MSKLNLIGVAAVGALTLASCSRSDVPASNATAVETQTPQTVAPTSSTTATMVPTLGRTIPINVQGSAPVGVTVRVKSVELGTDATILDVSASYGGTITNDVALAGSQTYLLDEQGNRLMLKAPQDNGSLRLIKGQTMDGKLVFLGAVPANAKSVKLVFNDGNDGNSIIDPGLTITLPLEAKAQ